MPTSLYHEHPQARSLIPLEHLQRSLAALENNTSYMPDDNHQSSSATAAANPPSASADPDKPASSTPPPSHSCAWQECTQSFSDPEQLYNHLCNDHIGRKSTNNLTLTCRWKECNTTCAKRDHITSHLRVHVPLKPHNCEVCDKKFKRPQDLKKHEKIHTEAHHAQHKHSKAITISDPSYEQRVQGADSSRLLLDRRISATAPEFLYGGRPKAPSVSSQSTPEFSPSSSSMHPFSSLSPDVGLLPTPSPELGYSHPHAAVHRNSISHGHASDIFLHPSSVPHHGANIGSLPSWEVLRDDVTSNPALGGGMAAAAGIKRGHDSVEDFFTDMKKRRVAPSYDPHMAERLSSLVYAHQQYGSSSSGSSSQQQHPPNFNPRSISLDIHSPEELAAVNDFLLTLGRDIASAPPNIGRRSTQDYGGHQSQQQQSQAQGGIPDLGSASTYFDPLSLSQLGLANMPGIPSIPSPASASSSLSGISAYGANEFQQNYSPPVRSRAGVQGSGLYPGLDEPRRAGSGSRASSTASSYLQTIALSPPEAHPPPPHSSSSSGTPTSLYHRRMPSGAGSAFRPTPPLSSPEGSGTRSPSPLSISSQGYAQHRAGTGMTEPPDGAANFDFLARSSAALQQPQLGAYDVLGARRLRTEVLLKTAPGREGDSNEDEDREREQRTRVVLPPPGPVEPRIRTLLQRGPPARLSSSLASAHEGGSGVGEDRESRKLYPLLEAGDAEFRLPPLVGTSSSSSRRSTPSSPSSSSAHRTARLRARSPSSEFGSPLKLPSFRSLTAELDFASSSKTGAVEGDLARGLSEIRIGNSGKGSAAVSAEERRRHAELIRDLLVQINKDYRERYGTPPPLSESSPRQRRRTNLNNTTDDRDVEMVAAAAQ
ncbi:hypothetical protein ACEPAG_415 [Sanghuangporus baumii]